MEKPPENRTTLPPKRFVAMLYIPLMVPAMVPAYMAMDQEDPLMAGIMAGTAVAVLVANAMILVLVYRWFARGAGNE